MPLSFAGRIARIFQDHPLTPILAVASLLIGLAALLVTPREEEPQIDVTMANVTVPFPGADVQDVENLVATPLEQRLAGMQGVKHVYSVSYPGAAILTVEFQVGVPRQAALVRLHNQIAQNQNLWPAGLGVGQPLVHARGIDDVPIMALTLWTDDPTRSPVDLAAVAHTLETRLKRIPGTRDVYTIGTPDRAAVLQFSPAKLSAYGLTLDDLIRTLQSANIATQAGSRIAGNEDIPLTAGTPIRAQDLATLVIGAPDGQPVRVSDVATLKHGADDPEEYVWFGAPSGRDGPASGTAPALTLAITKLSGTNAADITQAVRRQIATLDGIDIPSDIHVTVTRDYGQTSTDKAQSLLSHLFLATLSVVALVLLTLGWREAIVVGSAVIITLMLTLFASWGMGFTINRVSLFALIFSIGILVDDAIVVVENIHRHRALSNRTLREVIPEAVSEVGGPTILATLTVIAALLPMAFVSGLMGPYMRPIPINASAGMLLSLVVALVVTPWLSLKLLHRHHQLGRPAESVETAGPAQPTGSVEHTESDDSRFSRGFHHMMTPFLQGQHAARRRAMLFGAIGLLVLAALGLVIVKAVILKMLPFDNKSEFQVVIDMPEGSTVQTTNQVLTEMAQALDKVPEVLNYQGYAGTSAPVTFNGLVRQYYLRSGPVVGDLQVNLVDKNDRTRQSHAIARAVRPALAAIGARYGASVKVVEVPPGPPVLAPIVAEIYGPRHQTLQALAGALETRFRSDHDLVDLDTSVEADAQRTLLVIDRTRASRLGLSQGEIAQAIQASQIGANATYLRDGHSIQPVPVRLRLSPGDQAQLDALLGLRLRSRSGALVPLSAVVRAQPVAAEKAIYHKDLRPYAYVTADDAGATDSPLYGMFSMVSALRDEPVGGHLLEQAFVSAPDDAVAYTVKWDGEWQITYETFRDMGIAYAAGLVLIYLLIVAHFRRYILPLIIMAPIPLTIIGVMPGHALMGAQFTATSMIGMIALAGIIVRNSILLIDFIDLSLAQGKPLVQAVVDAAAIRAKPIMLTAFAAMIGGFFMLSDPIFQGLAVSLVFGILVSTLLTLLVIPLLYFAWLRHHHTAPHEAAS